MGGMGGMRGKRASVKQAQPDDSRLTRAAVGKKLGGCFGNGVELIAGQSHPRYACTASSSVQRPGKHSRSQPRTGVDDDAICPTGQERRAECARVTRW